MNIKEKSDTFNNIGCLEKQEEVAIKLLNKELKDPKYSLKVALKEASIIIKASQEVESNENLIQVKGVVEGRLPKVIADKLNLFENEDYCGIVMRYEGGGSLKKYLKSRNNLSLEVKLRILCGIARGLRNLHSKDIIHGDIKPENVLLSSHVPPIMRLADFGMSKQRKKMNHEIDGTTLILRLDDEKSINDGFKGTKLYSAPELLRSMNGKYLPTTRKTDMYSFGILMWEVLTQLSASESYGINTKDKFISEVCRGTRPSINALPNCTPVEIKQLIECCWNGDRTKRKTAIEALDILQSCYLELTSNFNKVILSHSGNNKKLVRYIDEYLKSFGVKMVNGSDGNNIGNTFVLDKQISNDSFKSSQSSISIDTSLDSQSKPCNANNRSNVMIVCLDSIYVKSRKCINEFNKNYHKEETFLLVLEDASIILNSASKLYASGPDEKESVAEDTDVSSQIVSPDLFTKISSIVSPSQENSNDESNCVLISDKISVSIWSDPNKDESNQLKDILYDCLHPLSKFLKSKFPDAIMDSLFPVISTRNDTSNVNQTPNLSDTSTLSDQSKSRRKLWLESSGRASSGISSSQHRVISLKSGSGSSESMI
jgi:serine/threonine protein kinase